MYTHLHIAPLRLLHYVKEYVYNTVTLELLADQSFVG